jgi:regulator of sigma E protease
MDFLPQFGSLWLTIAAFIVALSIIVAVHEYGHYIVGRWSGIHAEVFSIGFGRPLWSRKDRHGTRWQIAAIPLGGYVKFLGDANAASARPDEATLSHLSADERRHTLHGAPLWARTATVVAGPGFNFIFSVLIFAAFFLTLGAPTDTPTVGSLKALPSGTGEIAVGDVIVAVEGQAVSSGEELATLSEKLPSASTMTYKVLRDGQEMTVSGPTLYPALATGITPRSAAYEAGLKDGDLVTAADGVPVNGFYDLRRIVESSEGRALKLSVVREDGSADEITLTPKSTDEMLPEGGFRTVYRIGMGGSFFFEQATVSVAPWEAVTGAAAQVWFIITSSLSALWHIATGAISTCNLSGPIGIAETASATASQGLPEFIWFIAVLSTAVGFLNLFPIPMLDGGHLAFYVWEWARGKPPPERVLNMLATIGLAIVLALFLFGTTNDLFCP